MNGSDARRVATYRWSAPDGGYIVLDGSSWVAYGPDGAVLGRYLYLHDARNRLKGRGRDGSR